MGSYMKGVYVHFIDYKKISIIFRGENDLKNTLK